jgi:hypothetical protein
MPQAAGGGDGGAAGGRGLGGAERGGSGAGRWEGGQWRAGSQRPPPAAAVAQRPHGHDGPGRTPPAAAPAATAQHQFASAFPELLRLASRGALTKPAPATAEPGDHHLLPPAPALPALPFLPSEPSFYVAAAGGLARVGSVRPARAPPLDLPPAQTRASVAATGGITAPERLDRARMRSASMTDLQLLSLGRTGDDGGGGGGGAGRRRRETQHSRTRPDRGSGRPQAVPTVALPAALPE